MKRGLEGQEARLERLVSMARKATEALKAELHSPEFKKKIEAWREEERIRNKGFAERGENWRDIDIA